MPEVRPETLREVQQALQRYIAAVEQSERSPRTKKTHINHARYFVRWLNDDFDPAEINR